MVILAITFCAEVPDKKFVICTCLGKKFSRTSQPDTHKSQIQNLQMETGQVK